MEALIEFFLGVYKETPTHLIIIEFIAMIFGVISVFYSKKENILVYPTGIVSTALYVYILFHYELVGDLIINAYYTILSVYGWYNWQKNDFQLQVSTMKISDYKWGVSLFLLSMLFIYFVYIGFDMLRSIINYMDILTTGLFFVGMWLMTKKKVESWYIWIIANMISVVLYTVKGLGITSIQYIILLILAFQGLSLWKAKLITKN